MRKLIMMIGLMVLAFTAQAQTVGKDQLYSAGDISIRIGIGPFIPLYVHAFDFSNFSMSGMKVGFGLGLGVDVYLSNNFKLGGSIAFATSKGVNGNLSFLVPATMRIDWEFHALKFDFPIGVDVGLLFNRYRDLFAINFLIRPHAGAFFNITRSWSVGIDAVFWVVPQIVWDDLPKSRVGTFMEIVVAGRYRI